MSNRPLDHAAKQAQAEAQIIARAGHDMRQPLHALALFHGALKRRVAGDEQAQAIVARAEQAGAALSRVMLGVLALAEVNARGAGPAQTSAVALEEIFEALKLELSSDFTSASLTLRGGGTVSTAPDTLMAILRPLLLYAAASGGEVLLEARRDGAGYAVEVTWGGAMAEDVAALLAGDFLRAAATPRTARDGMDLALLVAARQAEALGVAIEASHSAGGTTIRIALPAA